MQLVFGPAELASTAAPQVNPTLQTALVHGQAAFAVAEDAEVSFLLADAAEALLLEPLGHHPRS